MADGFSCKTQIEHATDRRALHTAQTIKMALDHGTGGTFHGEPPEASYPDVVLEGPSPDLRTATLVSRALTGGALLWTLKRRLG